MLGIFKINKESHENIKKCLKSLTDKLKVIEEIEINNQIYQIEFFAGGDLKWLSNCFGINAANSKYPCPFCKFEMQDVMTDDDIAQNWPITRNHNEALNSFHLNSVDERQGYINAPILDFISFDNIIADILHLFLRISDKLFEMLLRELQMWEDPYGNKKKTADINDWPFTKSFFEFIEIECNVTAPFYIKESDTKSTIKFRKLNQNERLAIFNKMGGLDQIVAVELREKMGILRLTRLFNEFKEIMEQIKMVYENNFDKAELSKRLKKWLHDYIAMDPKITPYIHIFVYHIPDLIEKYKNLNLFSMQGMEKSNHFAKINFFRQTNHHKNGFTKTLLEKINRMEYIHLTSNE